VHEGNLYTTSLHDDVKEAICVMPVLQLLQVKTTSHTVKQYKRSTC